MALAKKASFQWMVSIILGALFFLFPTTDTYTFQIKLFFAITVFSIAIIAFDLLPTLIASLILLAGYALVVKAPLNVVFAPWLQTIPWMLLGGFILTNVLLSTGLLKRFAYWCFIRTGGSYNGILYGLMIVGILMALVGLGGQAVLFATLTYGICLALELGQSKASAGIMICGALAALVPQIFFFQPGYAGILFGFAGLPIDWFTYLRDNAIFLPWCFILVFMLTKMFKPEVKIQGKNYFIDEMSKLGPITKAEIKAIFVVAFVFIFILTSNWHGLAVDWAFILAPILLYLPGIDLGRPEDIKNVNFSFVIFVAACMAIGTVSKALGIGNIVSALLLPLLQQAGDTLSLIIVWLSAVVLNLVLTPLAAEAGFVPTVVQIATDLGVNPYGFLYVFRQGLNEVVLPHEWALILIFFSYGLIHMKDFIKFFSSKMVLNLVYLLILAVPYWKLIGVL